MTYQKIDLEKSMLENMHDIFSECFLNTKPESFSKNYDQKLIVYLIVHIK